jgi:hypothetical protein
MLPGDIEQRALRAANGELGWSREDARLVVPILAEEQLVAVTAGAIANTLGLAATLLAPAVVLLFRSVASMGRTAYCAGAVLTVTPPASQEAAKGEIPEVSQR